jgi:hypothetical protein
MSNPKDKAIELVNKFSTVGLQQREEGIACAIIAVNEILENFGTLTEGKDHYCAYLTTEYYEQVKEEIEKL